MPISIEMNESNDVGGKYSLEAPQVCHCALPAEQQVRFTLTQEREATRVDRRTTRLRGIDTGVLVAPIRPFVLEVSTARAKDQLAKMGSNPQRSLMDMRYLPFGRFSIIHRSSCPSLFGKSRRTRRPSSSQRDRSRRHSLDQREYPVELSRKVRLSCDVI